MSLFKWFGTGKRVRKVELELPLALRALATGLSVNLCFEECLRELENGFGELSRDFRGINRRIECGESVQEALLEWSRESGSREVRRAVMQLISSYENQEDPEALKRMSEEMLSSQKALMKEYSGKMVMGSLVFIAVSAIFPALFQAFVIVGSNFMSSTVSPLEALLIPVLVFPLIDVGVLVFLRNRRPFP